MPAARRQTRLLVPALAILAILAACAPAEAKRPPSRKSPHVQVDAVATVDSDPKRVTHANRRAFLEFTIRLESATKRPSASAGDDGDLVLDTTGRVKVVHDLSCGGAAVELKKGDRVEIGGEYVKPPRGGDLIHFTHPADGSCGRLGGHPDGYLRRKG